MTNSSCPILRYLPSTCMAGPTESVKNRQSRIGDLRDEARSTWLELEHDRVPVPVLAFTENVVAESDLRSECEMLLVFPWLR
jgi:hypothetical protein